MTITCHERSCRFVQWIPSYLKVPRVTCCAICSSKNISVRSTEDQ
jgi:transposase